MNFSNTYPSALGHRQTERKLQDWLSRSAALIGCLCLSLCITSCGPQPPTQETFTLNFLGLQVTTTQIPAPGGTPIANELEDILDNEDLWDNPAWYSFCFAISDADGDGYLDSSNEDSNGNGVLDPGEDMDQDGNLDLDESGGFYLCVGTGPNLSPVVRREIVRGLLIEDLTQLADIAQLEGRFPFREIHEDIIAFMETGYLRPTSGTVRFFVALIEWILNRPEQNLMKVYALLEEIVLR